jgi:hypothetical protein
MHIIPIGPRGAEIRRPVIIPFIKVAGIISICDVLSFAK